MYDRIKATHPVDAGGVRSVVDVQRGYVTVDIDTKDGHGRRLVKLKLTAEDALRLSENLRGAAENAQPSLLLAVAA